MLTDHLGIRVKDANDLFAEVAPLPVSEFFRTLLKRNLPIARGIGSEKVRSEMIIAPLLVELREINGHELAIFSRAEFNVEGETGLTGFCDFLVSHSPTLLSITSPVLAIVEAKREDLTSGIAQCIAEMVAASRFNQANGEAREVIYGAVTTGTNWRFLRLSGSHAEVDSQECFIHDVGRLLGILVAMTKI